MLIEKIGVLEELQTRLEAHLLQRRRVCFDSDSIERPINPLECHIVGYERQVTIVDVYTIGVENLFDLL